MNELRVLGFRSWSDDAWLHSDGSAIPGASRSATRARGAGSSSRTHSKRQLDCKQRQDYTKGDALHGSLPSMTVHIAHQATAVFIMWASLEVKKKPARAGEVGAIP